MNSRTAVSLPIFPILLIGVALFFIFDSGALHTAGIVMMVIAGSFIALGIAGLLIALVLSIVIAILD